jgi:MFS family permease
LSTWYTRKELAKRIGIFYAASVAASAFGGLLAFGVFHIHSSTMFSWSYLFILEGCLTVLVAILGLFVLPKSPRKAFFLSEEEKDIAERRILLDSVEYLENRFNWSEALYEFKSVHVYIRMLIMCSAGILVSSNGNFLAPIVASLGFSTVKTNLVCSNL